jgi:threonine dehydrogenase-like Zn-dependent dehydrogenase
MPSMKALVYQASPPKWLLCRFLRPVWKGCVWSGLGGLRLAEIPVPELPGEDWVRVRTLLAGICGTDLAIVAQRVRPDSILQAYGSQPMLLGHENVAVVEEVGPKVDRAWIGRRVCVEPTLGCCARGIEPMCLPCQQGQFGACENFGAAGQGRYALPAGTSIGYNARTGGAYGESFVAHVSQLVPAPDGLSDEELVLTDPVACGLHAVLRSRWQEARRILIYGPGAIGLGVIASLRALGYAARIDAAGRGQRSRQLACRLGADEYVALPKGRRQRFETIAQQVGGAVRTARLGNLMLDGGYDIVFECAGSVRSLEESVKWTRARGQVVLVGTSDGVGAEWTPVWFRELEVIGAYGRSEESWQGRRLGTYALLHELMTAGKMDLKGLVTHRYPLARWREAFAVAAAKSRYGAVKVVFDLRDSRPA